jgi:predicted dithiol-disulfide oxidoreductase (DUF899 family)
MATQQEKQAFIRHYKDVTGATELDMREVAKMAHSMGWELPVPADPLDLLAKQFSQAAREETRQDSQTGHQYRVYHAVKQDGNGQGVFWVDIDEASRKHMVKSAYARREQVIGDMVQLTLDLGHWNRKNASEEPIILITDVTDDVNERLAGPDEAAA